jgi:hypothetical protein
MIYSKGDVTLIKKNPDHLSHYRRFLEKHDYKLTVLSRKKLVSGTIAYTMKEIKRDPLIMGFVFQKDISCISEFAEDIIKERIDSRFEILDL